MVTRARLLSPCIVGLVMCGSATPLAMQPRATDVRVAPDFDIRDRRTLVAESPRAADAARDLRARHPSVVARYDGRRGIHTFHAPVSGLSAPDRRPAIDVARAFLDATNGALLDLDREDLDTLRVRDADAKEVSKGRLVSFEQTIDGVPVFDGEVTLHIGADGRIVRLVSSAVCPRDRLDGGIVGAEESVRLAAGNVRAQLDTIRPVAVERGAGPDQRTRMERGPFAREPIASLVYFPMDGRLRSAWHVVVQPEGVPRPYDIIVDARTGRILLRRNSYRPPVPPSRRAVITE